jgi:hypothetical protein
MRRLLGFAVAASAVAIAASAAAQQCAPKVPQGPNPIPPHYNWTPLARDWCRQLAACGYGRADCVATFVATAKSAHAGGHASGGGGAKTTKATVQLTCKDTEEFHAGTLRCERRNSRPPRRPRHGPVG